MGSSLFKFLEGITDLPVLNLLLKNENDDEEFVNYLEDVNYRQFNVEGIKTKFSKSKFSEFETKNEKYEKNEQNEDRSCLKELDSMQSGISSRHKFYRNSKIYQNEIEEKNQFAKKIINKSINREMRKMGKSVNNISTNDTFY